MTAKYTGWLSFEMAFGAVSRVKIESRMKANESSDEPKVKRIKRGGPKITNDNGRLFFFILLLFLLPNKFVNLCQIWCLNATRRLLRSTYLPKTKKTN